MKTVRLLARWLVIGACAALAGFGQTRQPAYVYRRLGNPQPRATKTEPGYALIGGGTDLDEAFQWMCGLSGGGDFLVLRASGTDAYNPYIQKLCPHENSLATLILPSRAAANDPFAAQAIDHAAAIFLSGGDQSNYINFWTGTPVQSALNAAIRRGVPIGGTSAGLAVLGEYVYSAQNDAPNGPDLTAKVALANPYQKRVVWAHDFVSIPSLRGMITDTHFHTRNRLGRLLVFMARIRHANPSAVIHGLGVDQHTAVLVTPDGAARVAGTGAAYFFTLNHSPQVCRAGEPLSVSDVGVERLTAGQAFRLHEWNGPGVKYELSVNRGAITSTQPGGAIY